jgi:hypothetical protein
MGLSITTIAWVTVIIIAMLVWMYCDIHNGDPI